MDKDQKKQVTNALVDFVIRVSNGNATTEKEVSILPEVARLLLTACI